MDQGRDPGILEPLGDIERSEIGGLGPALDRDPTVAGVERDRDTTGIKRGGLGDEGRVAHRRGADDDAGDAGGEPGFDRAEVANTAAELQRHRRRCQDALDRGDIDRLAGKGAVEIDDVEIFEALRRERPRLRRRIAMKHRRARHVALLEPHAGAVLEIDGGKEDHGRSLSTLKHDPEKCAAVFGKDHAQTSAAAAHGVHFRKLAISRKPSRWLFSGWNWVPTTVSRPTTAVTGPP